jgi:hypothetical protein
MYTGESVMIMERDNIETLRRHLEKMEEFRLTHRNNRSGVLVAPNDIPFPCNTPQQNCDNNDFGLFTAGGNPVVVPIWKVEPVEGSQN